MFVGCTTNYTLLESGEIKEFVQQSNSINYELLGEAKEEQQVWKEVLGESTQTSKTTLILKIKKNSYGYDMSPAMPLFLGLVPATTRVYEYKFFLYRKSGLEEKIIREKTYSIAETWGSNNTIQGMFKNRKSYNESLKDLISFGVQDIMSQPVAGGDAAR